MTTEEKRELIEQVNSVVDREFAVKLQNFNKLLNIEPKQNWVKVFEGAKYVPIRIQENLLRMIFGVFKTRIIDVRIMANSVVATLEIDVLHPILKEWITYAGVGAVPIQLKKGSGSMEIENILSKALHKNAPSAKSFAFLNACKTIGKIFGSELNTKQDETINLQSMYSELIGESEKHKIRSMLLQCGFDQYSDKLGSYYSTSIEWAIENEDRVAFDIIMQELDTYKRDREVLEIGSGGKVNITEEAKEIMNMVALDDAKEQLREGNK